MGVYTFLTVQMVPNSTKHNICNIEYGLFGNTMCINEFGEMLGRFILVNCCHFLHNCETLLDKAKTDQNTLLEILNSINSAIIFTMKISNKEQPF